MDDQRVGGALRAVRIRKRWRQKDVAARAGVSPAMVSLLERGHLDRVSLLTLRRVAAVLDVRLDVVARWRGGELDRLMNAAHAALHEEVARYFGELSGWQQLPEVSFAFFGERGVIDILAYHEASGALLVVELKTELVSIEDLLSTTDRRMRLAARIAGERGWHAATVSAWVVVAESDANRRRAGKHAATLRSGLPANGHQMRAWLGRPEGSIAALSFWANSNRGGVKQRLSSEKRVRCR
ncbi:MAG TPA: helix-turn-helix domain-containing protein [Candidatus Caenarcaniphilales bacterium]|nr:helix-turn-helix domain-containing protein [Candidatus Caenarcaniphilales bacterium]